jgi:flavin-dependent dehydrogenase
MNDKTDVLVIGAGPAGSIAAAKIRQAGYSVTVVEREHFPRFVIGESLLPRCMEVLDDVDLLHAVNKMGYQKKFGAKFLKDDEVSDFNFESQYTKGWTWTWQVPRASFDLTLIEEVKKKGAEVHFETTVTAIDFLDDERSLTTIKHKDGTISKIEARFIVDASGYGRVIPRLFNLDKPSALDPRKAVFAHVKDIRRDEFEEPNRIIVVLYAPGVWVWIIPFSNGITSLGFVGQPSFFDTIGKDLSSQFPSLIQGHPYLAKRFAHVPLEFEPRKLEAWSTTTERFYGEGFVLTGNVTEFLDPIFSSGVMFATVSSHLAAQLVIRKLNGEEIDWEKEYSQVIQQGVDTFRSYVMSWYDGTLEKIFFAKNPEPLIKQQICSVLAGYVWDQTNPFVRQHKNALKKLVRVIEIQQLSSPNT